MNTIEDLVRTRWDSLTKPRGSLGVLEESIVRLAVIQRTATPRLARRGMYVFCGDHGIAEEGVSLYPSVVTREMVKNFVRGGAAINVLCRQLAIEPCIVDAGVAGTKIDGVIDRRIAEGTANFRRGPAMSREQAQAALDAGRELAEEAASRFDVVGVGEMGIGNTTAASALLCAFAGASVEDAVGRGTGLDDAGLSHKREVLAESLALHQVNSDDGVGVLAAYAGFEIAMMAGFIRGAVENHLPVVVDGFISGSALLAASSIDPSVTEGVFVAHRSAEKGHAVLLRALGATPLLDLQMRLGEGTGAALAIGLLTSALGLYNEMATFSEASVSDAGTKEATRA